MSLLVVYHAAGRDEKVARLGRLLALLRCAIEQGPDDI